MAKQAHLTLEERKIIEVGLNNGSTRKSIADTLGKDKSTICKEVKRHTVKKTYKSSFGRTKGTYDCIHISQCGFNHYCPEACEEKKVPIPCKRRDRTVGVCNGCEFQRTCKLDKRFYSAEQADSEYKYTLSDSRLGANMTSSQANQMAETVKECLNRNVAPYVIVQQHPELGICEKTLYNYIEQGVLPGVMNIDLPKKVSRKRDYRNISKKYNKRNEKMYLKGRTYSCFLKYIDAHPGVSVVEMDTVYNDRSGGPYIQTFFLNNGSILFGVLHNEKTAANMTAGLNFIKERIGNTLFKKFFQVILTDRGSEFTQASEIEELGCKIFYCDPLQSSQKAHVENKHGPLRFILPNQVNLRTIGLNTQDDLDLVFSHLNSYPVESLYGKTPYEFFAFMFGPELLKALHIQKIPPEKVCMNPKIFKK